MILSFVPVVNVSADYSGICGANLTWEYSGHVLTISGSGDMNDFESVTSPPWKKSDCNYIYTYVHSIVIKDGVTSIGKNAFYGFPQLTSVTISESVETIGKTAFSGCQQLTSVTIPGSVETIGEGAFSYCKALTDLTLRNGIKNIDTQAFQYCPLKRITIPESVENIGAYAFRWCNLTSITIPKNVEQFYTSALSGNENLSSINVADENQYFSSVDGVLYNYDKTKLILYPPKKSDNSYIIPYGVTYIAAAAFYSCSNLQSVIIPDSVTTIGSSAFYNCTQITNITIPNSVISIESSTFSGCNALKTVIIPKSVTYIGASAFSGCDNLEDIYYLSSEKDWNNITIDGNQILQQDLPKKHYIYSMGTCGDNISYMLYADGTLVISGIGEMENYTNSASVPWSAYSNEIIYVVIDNGIENISPYAFYACSQLTDVTIYDSIVDIGDYAFYGCSGLSKVTFYGTKTQHDKISLGSNVGLNLNIFEFMRYTILYNANGGTHAPNSQVKTKDVDLTLTSEKPQYLGHVFIGWSSDPNADVAEYAIGGAYSNDSGDTTLYAVWELEKYTISYNASGGTNIPLPQAKFYSQPLIITDTIPTKEGYTFLGWTETEGSTEVDYEPGDAYTKEGDATLYAVWKCQEVLSTKDSGAYIMEPDNYVEVDLFTEDDSMDIYYTVDGSEPTTSSTKYDYTNPIVLSSPMTVKAIAVKENCVNSDVAVFTYIRAEKPTIIGVYEAGKSISIAFNPPEGGQYVSVERYISGEWRSIPIESERNDLVSATDLTPLTEYRLRVKIEFGYDVYLYSDEIFATTKEYFSDECELLEVLSPKGTVTNTETKEITGARVTNSFDSAIVQLKVSSGATWQLYETPANAVFKRNAIEDNIVMLEAGKSTKVYISITAEDGLHDNIYSMEIYRQSKSSEPVFSPVSEYIFNIHSASESSSSNTISGYDFLISFFIFSVSRFKRSLLFFVF